MENYQDRLIAFIDILGFKDIIEKSLDSESEITISKIKEALKFVDPVEERKMVLGEIGDISDSDHQMATFSDCIVISTEATQKGLFNILNHSERIGFQLFRMNFLCRGGITRGLVCHDNQFLFGPGFIRAYLLESRKAKYPRIIIDPKVEDLKKSLKQVGTNIFERYTKQSENDEYIYVDVLRQLRLVMNQISEPPKDIKQICTSIAKKLQVEKKKHQNDPNELEKLEWFSDYFNATKDREHIENLNSPFPK